MNTLQKIYLVNLVCFLPGVLLGNEVLDLLEKEDTPRAPQSYDVQDQSSGSQRKSGKKKVRVFDPDRISRDWLWEQREPVRDKRSVIYDAPTDPFIQKAALDAYWHWAYQNGTIDHDTFGETRVETSRTRRLRIGGLIRALYKVDIEGQILLDGNLDYRGIETLQLRGHLTDHTYLTVGKGRVPFSYHNTLDPTRRRIVRRPALTTQLAPANTLGVLLEGTSNGDNGVLSWGLGWYSGDVDRDLPDTGRDGFILAKVEYFVPTTIGGKDGGQSLYQNYQHWHLDYVHNLDGANSMSIRSGHDHLISTGLDLRIDHTDLSLNVLFATGGAASVWGVNVEAGYWVMDSAVRLVGRYQYAESNSPDSLVVGFGPTSVGSDAGLPYNYSSVLTGDSYNSVYLGADFHLYGENAVLSAGLEYQVLSNSDVLGQEADALIFHWNIRFAF